MPQSVYRAVRCSWLTHAKRNRRGGDLPLRWIGYARECVGDGMSQ